MMTARERAEALVDRLDDVWTFTEAVALIETALDEHARAPAARDACAHEWLEGRGLLCTKCGEMLFIEATPTPGMTPLPSGEEVAEQVRALLAETPETVEAMARAMVDAYCIRGLGAPDDRYITQADREAARAVLAALRGKALGD
jgi:hypothetical protein